MVTIDRLALISALPVSEAEGSIIKTINARAAMLGTILVPIVLNLVTESVDVEMSQFVGRSQVFQIEPTCFFVKAEDLLGFHLEHFCMRRFSKLTLADIENLILRLDGLEL